MNATLRHTRNPSLLSPGLRASRFRTAAALWSALLTLVGLHRH